MRTPDNLMNMHQVTLPIETKEGLRLDPSEARGLGDLLALDYASATPFPHIVMDGFLPEEVIRKARAGFPSQMLKSDRVFDMQYAGQQKRQILPEECDPSTRDMFYFFNSKPILQFLEGLTGISGLIPDPYFSGGGYHEISRGGLLGIHADFRVHNELNLERRLNLLVYLNDPWDESWGGKLELWDREMKHCERAISPLLNRCVVFSTDAESFHGHPDPLATPEGITRKSIALYYYTASRAVYGEVPNYSTMYYARPGDSKANRGQAFWLRFDERLKDWLPLRMAQALSLRRRRLMGQRNKR